MRIRTYSELSRIKTFEERFEYLKLNGAVGKSTFGFERYLNQAFYTSKEWRRFRNDIIVRDNGLDLGVEDHEIFDFITIHHIVPITIADIENGSPSIFDPGNVICTSKNTHRAIHYGDASLLVLLNPERKKGDTDLWRASSRRSRNFSG